MSRILISIGCNEYENLPRLAGAESDANKIAAALIGPNRYQYRQDKSRTLLSPTMADFRATIVSLYEESPTEIALYFAGHAESRDGRLYLKVKDTRENHLPPTSMSVGELLDQLSQIPTITQLNLIIDACNAGGIRSDLARILGEHTQHGSQGMSLSILAGSAPDRAAIENAEGGKLTTAIHQVLLGTLVAQRWSPYLDLSQISAAVSRIPEVKAQGPSFWTMNLHGPSILSVNPAFDPAVAAVASPDDFFSGNITLSPEQLAQIERFVHDVRARGYHPAQLPPVMSAISSLPTNQQVGVVLGLAESVDYYEKDKTTCPPEREMMLVQALTPLASSQAVAAILGFHSDILVRKVGERLMALNLALQSDAMTLVNRPSGFGELFYLPIRVLQVLGWVGFMALHAKDSDTHSELLTLTRRILDAYGNSVVALDDRQAPALAMFVMGAKVLGWSDEAEGVLARLFSDLERSLGRVARTTLDGKQRLKYLLKRYDKLADDLVELSQQPSELIAATLLLGAVVGMDDAWDSEMRELDGRHINIFVASTPLAFADDRMAEGENLSMQIGHDMFRLADMRRFFQGVRLSDAIRESALSPSMDALSIFLGDRTNWARLRRMIDEGGIRPFSPRLVVSSEDPNTGSLEELYNQESSS